MEVESALVDHPRGGRSGGGRRAARDQGSGDHGVRHAEGRLACGGPPLVDELKAHVAKKIGAIARPEEILFTAGSARRRAPARSCAALLRDIAEGRALGDTTTLADPSVVSKLKDKYEEDHPSE